MADENSMTVLNNDFYFVIKWSLTKLEEQEFQFFSETLNVIIVHEVRGSMWKSAWLNKKS